MRIKVEGMRGKLENKYRGKYYINGIKRGGNYELKTSTGTILKQSYPINKLKPIEEDEDDEGQQVEVERIIKHRVTNVYFMQDQ